MMGYMTRYNLGTYDSDADIYDILSKVTEKEFEGLNYAIDEYGNFYDSIKWYDHEEDMKKLSLKFPDVTFELEGDGEERGDQWKKYFKNGKSKTCKAIITFESFDKFEFE